MAADRATHGIKRFFHEAVGEMRLNHETLALPGDRGQTVVVYTVDTGSASEENLSLLGSWTAPATERNGPPELGATVPEASA